MNTFLVILLVAAMLATVVALVRGIISFLQEQSAQVRSGGDRPTAGQLKSNRMMQQRIMFQAAAILVCVLLLAAAGRS
ncbi:twin transmembrane helix small protein [uncultured Sphingomonas sp.]|uniref:twin transmembrane helix small protein n=1 Tax=uncultured Sphingomonas sp. TaxID=158754 RepID=UPI0025EC12C8|nr:twin transmembrane helix small protein [uncultured Sphingomonas sp.]